eukprot:3650400-Rhodomonas_salina.3
MVTMHAGFWGLRESLWATVGRAPGRICFEEPSCSCCCPIAPTTRAPTIRAGGWRSAQSWPMKA